MSLFGTVLCCTAADRPTLRVCADPNNLPFSNRMGQGLENNLAVSKGDVDLAIAWGPFAGYFAKRTAVPLVIEPVSPLRFQIVPFTYAIGVAVRKGDAALQAAIQQALDKECQRIRGLLKDYAFPSPEEDAPSCAASPSAAAFSH
ncbi:MAG: hypothetical protein C5B51_23745 [Terriglobia bacterium]|nr:MAG: hypothetical protein C5B51_23745 [Terriglobia bacterium]